MAETRTSADDTMLTRRAVRPSESAPLDDTGQILFLRYLAAGKSDGSGRAEAACLNRPSGMWQ